MIKYYDCDPYELLLDLTAQYDVRVHDHERALLVEVVEVTIFLLGSHPIRHQFRYRIENSFS